MAKQMLGLEDLLPTSVARASAPRPRKSKPTTPTIDPFTLPISSFTLTTTSIHVIPNEFPTIIQPYRIAVIGEAPSRDEEITGKPFMGMSGNILTNMLGKVGILRQACFLGNICQRRPYNNDYSLADPLDIEEGITKLTEDLAKFNPNICILLGNTPLHLAKNNANVGDWRGSFFISDKSGPFHNRKCLATYHPAACLRQYEWTPLLMFDIKKASAEALHPTLTLPQRALTTNLTAYEISTRLENILHNPAPISIDIEGGINSMSCISIAVSPENSFIIQFSDSQGGNYWSNFDDELLIWTKLADVLASPLIPKILQNALYDRFVLQYCYSLCICSNTEDTMLKSWELYCELEKGLGFLCSLYTREPFYKGDRKSDDMNTFWRYCCRDSAVTYEIATALTPMLPPLSTKHYQFNVDLLNPLLYMELRGIPYDIKKAQEKLTYVNSWINRLQYQLDELAGVGVPAAIKQDRQAIKSAVQEVMCMVRDRATPKKEFRDAYPKICSFLEKTTPLSEEDFGYISIEARWSMNIKSTKFKSYLYDTLNLPKQYGKENELTGTKSLTTDGKALLKIQKKQPHPAVDLAIQIGELRTRSQMLHISADEDGRIRCGYNIVGADTGRITCYTSPTGSGYNLQTIPDDYESYPDNHPLRYGMRDLLCADKGCYMFQCDLKGSDGWTIGANLASLGAPAMLDDLRSGIKPASRICYMLRHGNGSLLRKSRDEVKELLKEIKKTDWDYFACKVGIWGICYLMGPDLLGEEIMEESQGKMSMTRKEVEDFRNAVYVAYSVRLWHDAMKRKLFLDKATTMHKRELIVPSGHKRRFFNRPKDVLGQALAHEPQANTTYATNLAAWKLWRDPENRMLNWQQSMGSRLRIEPFHQVHDALIGQFLIEDTAWAISKIKSYFDNTFNIAGIPITIPFEGNYGINWGDLSIGSI